ncbi:hypothetical protein AAE02nite_22490 [Adhaeribacter aerolatus]|uniref:Uncharacterized protein n=1 Tax=Adhaeribacter aerolatus TaxID=670289 RepID=A0A512AXY3_9BACT|nr:hypothetical protein [Adhaeribacter aerolatus]GEO04585.1 hypothetical protein AAE02nite_22490 [Adhaeribacter aerolatus]
MPDLLLNLKFVLPFLLIINVLTVLLYRKNLRYIKGPVIFFIILFGVFLGYRFLIFPVQQEKVQASRQAEIQKQKWDYLNDPEKDAAFAKQEINYQQNNLALFRITGLQAAFSAIFSCLGLFLAPDKKVHAGFAMGFFLLAFLFLT